MFFDKYHIFKEENEGFIVDNYIIKKVPDKAEARLYLQLNMNLRTDIDIKVVKDGEVVKQDLGLKKEGGSSGAIHNV